MVFGANRLQAAVNGPKLKRYATNFRNGVTEPMPVRKHVLFAAAAWLLIAAAPDSQGPAKAAGSSYADLADLSLTALRNKLAENGEPTTINDLGLKALRELLDRMAA